MSNLHDNDVNTLVSAEHEPPLGKCGPTDALVSVCIPGETAFIPVARQTVDALGEKLRLSPSDRAAVKLAVGEACNNAVLHPNSPQQIPQVTVACRVLPNTLEPSILEIDVTNQGNGFHRPVSVKMPDAELLSESGRGMALMELMMDSVEYLSVNGNTVVRMRKHYTPSPN